VERENGEILEEKGVCNEGSKESSFTLTWPTLTLRREKEINSKERDPVLDIAELPSPVKDDVNVNVANEDGVDDVTCVFESDNVVLDPDEVEMINCLDVLSSNLLIPPGIVE
jgi:hypothetical protein